MNTDPVCGMTVDEKTPHQSFHGGQTHLFCSPGCQAKFDKEPGRYAILAAEEPVSASRP